MRSQASCCTLQISMLSLFPILLIVYFYIPRISFQPTYWKDSQRGNEFTVIFYPSTPLSINHTTTPMPSISVSAHSTSSSPFPTSTSSSTLPSSYVPSSAPNHQTQPTVSSSMEDRVDKGTRLLPVLDQLSYCR